MKSVEVFDIMPEGFSPNVEVSCCHLEKEGKILFLQYADTHHQAGTWGVPGGKIEAGESAEAAATRELFEETTLVAKEWIYLAPLFIKRAHVEYVFHLFQMNRVLGNIQISAEHQDFRWVSHEELLALNLVDGAREAYLKFKELGVL